MAGPVGTQPYRPDSDPQPAVMPVSSGLSGTYQPMGGGSSSMLNAQYTPAVQPLPGPSAGGKGVGTPTQPVSQSGFQPGTQSAQMSQGAGQNVFQQSAQGLTDAMTGARQAMGYQPMQVQGTGYAASQMGDVPGVAAGQLASTNLRAYANPFESQVVQQGLSDLERSRQMAMNTQGAQASAAGAFGGSRQGVAEAETNRGYADQAARLASGLRQAGFQNAQQMAQQDIGTRMQAGLANQSAMMNQMQANQAAQNQAAQFNAQNLMNAQQLNQSAGLSGAQMRLSGTGQLGGLSQQGFNMGQDISNQQYQQGLAQQAMNQALIDASKGQYQGFQNAPATALGYMGQALGSTPNVSSTTQSRQPGVFDYLTLGASLSDERLKSDISKVGELDNGLDVVTWKWTDMAKKSGLPLGDTKGLIAQQVAKIVPDAIKRHASGYLMVDYSHPELRGAI